MAFDVIVLGGGPGGYVAAIRAAQLGLKTAVIEKAELGGICLNWGCIPTKALLKSAEVFNYLQHAADYGLKLDGVATPDFPAVVKRSRNVASAMQKGVKYLLSKNKVEVITGYGRLKLDKRVEVTFASGEREEFRSKNIVIATGARSRVVPSIPQDGKTVLGYREALTLAQKPDRMLVIGSGAIGMEFAHFYASIGTQVTLVEREARLAPAEDDDVSAAIESSFRKRGIKAITGASVEKIESRSGRNVAKIRKGNDLSEVEFDVALSSVGIVPNTENIGLAELGIKTSNGFIPVNGNYETTVPGYYAIGDCIDTPALAHVASAEGIACIEHIAGHQPEKIDYSNIPSCVYTSPEIASVGLTERAAKEAKIEYRIGLFPFSASGKARAGGAGDGFVKLIVGKEYGEILGAHMVGANVTEMIAEVVAARKLEATAAELVKTIHPHPTMSEAVMEAAASALGEAIHY